MNKIKMSCLPLIKGGIAKIQNEKKALNRKIDEKDSKLANQERLLMDIAAYGTKGCQPDTCGCLSNGFCCLDCRAMLLRRKTKDEEYEELVGA